MRMLEVDIGDSVHFLTDHKTTGAGVPVDHLVVFTKGARASRSSARKGQKPLMSPVGVAFRAVVHGGDPANLLLGLGKLAPTRGSPGSLREADLVRELAAPASHKAPPRCARASARMWIGAPRVPSPPG